MNNEEETGNYLLYILFIFGALSIGKIYGISLAIFIGLIVVGISLSYKPIVKIFKKENNNSLNNQLFWISIFLGVIAFILFIIKGIR
ncbi:hypothetical protein ACPB8Q_06940 [Methanocaldococcus indicus]|uniref:hypothetical protein n=1 Tax=Methanocaldococcus indicus TaxID=213231 RepID=UPI003C6CEF5B